MDNPRFVYIIFADDSVYIGRTDDLIRRMRAHDMLYCDWAVLETTDSLNVRKAEAKWVKHFIDLGVKVLNLDDTCRDGNLGHSEATRRKISHSLKGLESLRIAGRIGGRKNAESGQIQELGRTQGRKNVESGQLARIRAAAPTTECCSKGGTIQGPKNLPKLLAAATSESCAKGGRAGKGRHFTEEHRRRLSESIKRTKQLRRAA